MKICRLFLILTFLVIPAYANNSQPPEPTGPKVGSTHGVPLNYLNSSQWTIGLDDGSFWSVQRLESRPKQTWYEWWNGITPKTDYLDDSYFFNPHEWSDVESIQVYKAQGGYFPGYQHILENMVTGQKAFAKYTPHGSLALPKMEFAENFFSNPVGDPVVISRNRHYINNQIVLADRSIWKVKTTQAEDGSWSDWWSGQTADQPDAPFLFKLSGWKPGETIRIYKYDVSNAKLRELNNIYGAENQKWDLYLISNESRQNLAYVEPVKISEFVDSYQNYANDQWTDGYNRGHEKGYEKGYKKGNEDGYSSGHQSGYAEGYKKGYKDASPPDYDD